MRRLERQPPSNILMIGGLSILQWTSDRQDKYPQSSLRQYDFSYVIIFKPNNLFHGQILSLREEGRDRAS